MSGYDSWLVQVNEMAIKAKSLIESYGLQVSTISEPKKPVFLRVKIGKQKMDFCVKPVRSRHSAKVWLCKKDDFSTKKNFIIYQKKEDKFVVATGSQIKLHSEIKDSDYHENQKIVVVPMDIFYPLKLFFKSIKAHQEIRIQKRMNEWT